MNNKLVVTANSKIQNIYRGKDDQQEPIVKQKTIEGLQANIITIGIDKENIEDLNLRDKANLESVLMDFPMGESSDSSVVNCFTNFSSGSDLKRLAKNEYISARN